MKHYEIVIPPKNQTDLYVLCINLIGRGYSFSVTDDRGGTGCWLVRTQAATKNMLPYVPNERWEEVSASR
jgi:hypothetical protein